MAFVNCEKTLKYLKLQESLRSENLRKYYLHTKGYFYTFFSTLKYIEVQSNKVIILAKTLRSFN